jgi:tetratricopeptide (TPR) repeat protein
VLASAVVIAWLRPGLFEDFRRVRVTSDVYALPAPEQTIALSLGYRSALADLLYAHVLVSSGIHFQEKRRFEFVGNYLDTINALDPAFRSPYHHADALLTLQTVRARREDYYKAREILERGLRARPFDSDLWLTAGQYISYLGPQYLSPSEQKEWKRTGARILARACELVGDNRALPYHCIAAAGVLNQQGNREAVIDFLERVIAVTDEPEIRELALGYLERAIGERQHEQAKARLDRFAKAKQQDLPFVSLDLLLTLAPAFDWTRCAGSLRSDPECRTSWREWSRTQSAD